MNAVLPFFDTAEIYVPFTNEQLVGKALSPARRFLTGAINANTQFAEGDFRNTVPRLASDTRETNMQFLKERIESRVGLHQLEHMKSMKMGNHQYQLVTI